MRAGELGHDETASALGRGSVRRNTVSVTPTMGASTVAGWMCVPPIWNPRGNISIYFSVLSYIRRNWRAPARLTLEGGEAVNTKVLLGFLGGLLAATGVFYVQSHRSPPVEAVPPQRRLRRQRSRRRRLRRLFPSQLAFPQRSRLRRKMHREKCSDNRSSGRAACCRRARARQGRQLQWRRPESTSSSGTRTCSRRRLRLLPAPPADLRPSLLSRGRSPSPVERC